MRWIRTDRRHRAGFTLVELLVVIAVIGILVSLSAVGYLQVRKTRMRKTSEDVVSKLQLGIDNQVKIIADNVRQEQAKRTPEFEKLFAYCDGDTDRAAALLLYCRLKQNFPQVSELTVNGSPSTPSSGFSVAGVTFPWPQPFLALRSMSGSPEEQSAAVLYVALSQRVQGGNAFASDEATSGAQTDLNGFRIYKDAWGNPIPFARFTTPDDLPGNRNQDPFDPRGKLASWNSTKRDAAEDVIVYAPNATPTPPPSRPVVFNNLNKGIIAYSWGDNEQPEGLKGDDIAGYRLRALGNMGVTNK